MMRWGKKGCFVYVLNALECITSESVGGKHWPHQGQSARQPLTTFCLSGLWMLVLALLAYTSLVLIACL